MKLPPGHLLPGLTAAPAACIKHGLFQRRSEANAALTKYTSVVLAFWPLSVGHFGATYRLVYDISRGAGSHVSPY